jgi:hypothetical protein
VRGQVVSCAMLSLKQLPEELRNDVMGRLLRQTGSTNWPKLGHLNSHFILSSASAPHVA